MFEMLFLVFLVLKLSGVIAWCWWVVYLPLIIVLIVNLPLIVVWLYSFLLGFKYHLEGWK